MRFATQYRFVGTIASKSSICYPPSRPTLLVIESNRHQTHGRLLHCSQSSPTTNEQDFFRYTAGRWLWNEEERLRERYREFNVQALKHVAASVTGASKCVSMCKLAEGGFNKVFRLTMDNNASIIARIPNQTSKGVPYSLASEVATMDFASKILGIPVPKVLSWDNNSSNQVQAEYILMEEARGTPLNSMWHSMSIKEKDSVVDELVSIEKRLLSVSSSQYGNIYLATSYIPGCEQMQIQGSIDPALKSQAEQRYRIGPAVESSFWDAERSRIPGVRGPWPTPQQYIRSICEREIQWLSQHADPSRIINNAFAAAIEKDPAVHISMYQKLLKASDYLLPSTGDTAKPVLWHWDLHDSNIFVQDGKITSIIDWQDCWAGPLVLQARRPALIDYQGEMMLRLPPDFDSIEDEEEKESIRSQVERSILAFCYDDSTNQVNPELARIYQDLPHRQLLCDTVVFAANTWDSEIVMLRECLIRLRKKWNEIFPDSECPYAFTQEELDAHDRQSEGWNENADFWSSISHLVSRDGFVLPEDYDTAIEMFAELREKGLEYMEGESREEFERATRWAVRKG